MAGMQQAPSFAGRESISSEDLPRVCDPVVIFEGEWRDSDGALCQAYSVAGLLDGRVLGSAFTGGVLVGDQAIVVHGSSREEADFIAIYGLMTTIHAEHKERDRKKAAMRALERMRSVSPFERLEQAIKKPADKSDAFVEDSAAIQVLTGVPGGADTSKTVH